MTRKEACRILGISPGDGQAEIKKKYRQRMMQTHPDADLSAEEHRTRCAQEINLAYAVLKSQSGSGRKSASRRGKGTAGPSGKRSAGMWNAPVNENAYCEREILHEAEDSEGSVLGHICIARGKYLWSAEEGFPLFLLSIYRCAGKLLDEAGPERQRASETFRHEIQAEVAYLLAQQFTDCVGLLHEFALEETEDRAGRRIWRIAAMLELSDAQVSLRQGETIYPSAVRRHRLYLKDQDGREIGYLSFPDDRLYYVVIPLFEQRAAQVRIRAAQKQPEKRKRSASAAGYQNLDLWLRWSPENRDGRPENLNLQIEQLLKRYKTM